MGAERPGPSNKLSHTSSTPNLMAKSGWKMSSNQRSKGDLHVTKISNLTGQSPIQIENQSGSLPFLSQRASGVMVLDGVQSQPNISQPYVPIPDLKTLNLPNSGGLTNYSKTARSQRKNN